MFGTLALNNSDLLILILICFFAGLIRGFSGFGLSAFVMSLALTIIPPIELIPVCWWMEFVASVFMIRNGWKDSDKKISIILWLGAVFGLPIGIALTTILDFQTSKIVALVLILILALILLRNFKIQFLSTSVGTISSGVFAGVATGLASIGGMIVAIYVLASQNSARRVRASIVLYIFLNSVTTFIFLILFDVMDHKAFVRGVLLAVPSSIGVVLGSILFMQKLEKYYRPFSLGLLISFSLVGLIRLTG
tara:strand:- start:36 stop:785 length:750 start_codon:yes stop_codon:yes gene_type:complete